MSDDGRDGDASACSGGHASPPLTVTLAPQQTSPEIIEVLHQQSYRPATCTHHHPHHPPSPPHHHFFLFRSEGAPAIVGRSSSRGG